MEGVAEAVTEMSVIEDMVHGINDKYGSDVTVDFMDPDVNATIRVAPRWAFGIIDAEFAESPTRWDF